MSLWEIFVLGQVRLCLNISTLSLNPAKRYPFPRMVGIRKTLTCTVGLRHREGAGRWVRVDRAKCNR